MIVNFDKECKNNGFEEPMVGLSDLIKGAAYLYLGDKNSSVNCFRVCLKKRVPSNDSTDQHVSAFALYELGSTLCYVNVSEKLQNKIN